jgi:hypothetical protein
MSEQNISSPSATSGTSELSELKEQCAELQRQTHSLRVALLVVALCLAGFLALEGRRNGQALQLLRPQAAQVAEAAKIQDPIANRFLGQLVDFAKGHQDFGAVLGKYVQRQPGAPTAASTPTAAPVAAKPAVTAPTAAPKK